jgi:uncharacterized protein YciI
VAHLLLLYDYVEDVAERRPPHREAHLAALRREGDAGHVVLAGAVGDPPTGAAIVFSGVDAEHENAFAEADPYVRAGLVRAWRVEPYNVVVQASPPE